MSFTSIQFVLLVGGLSAALRVVRHPTAQKSLLVLASLGFYATWSMDATALLVALAGGAWAVGASMERAQSGRWRRVLLTTGVLAALAVLGAFKYYDFFADILSPLAGCTGLPTLRLFVAAGMSFIVFQVISYLSDVYRGGDRARGGLDVLLLVSFFPHLIAGPILRSSTFLRQLDAPLEVRWRSVERGVVRYLFGVVQKLLIADRLAMFVDTVYGAPDAWSGLTIWLAVFAYALQIYFDFSGYTDMAIGAASCLGLTLPENFRAPYLAHNVTDFWRRWHISLSSWIRDYVYIPLGGNRKGRGRQALNQMVTMGLAGLWHGAGWGFVLWGLAHGAALVVHKWFANLRREANAERQLATIGRVGAWALTFVFVTLAWVLFRSADTAMAFELYGRLAGAGTRGPTMTWVPTSLIAVSATMVFYALARSRGFSLESVHLTGFRGGLLLGLTLGAITFLAPVTATPFVYAGF